MMTTTALMYDCLPVCDLQSKIRGAVTIADRADDTGAWRRRDTSSVKVAALLLELTSFSLLSFEGQNSIVTSGTPG